MTTDADLAARNRATLLACFEENARSSPGARLVRGPGVAIAVFTTDPEARFLQNAVLDRGLSEPEVLSAITAAEEAYAAVEVAEFAIWTVEGDAAAEAALESRGYRFSESTLAMGMELRDLRPAAPEPRASRPAPEVAWGDWSAYRELLELPDFLLGADEGAYRIATARVEGGGVEGMAFHHDGDCGIFNVGTTEGARRRGLGTAVMRALLDDAVARGCTTASLQSTPMAESLYASLGFRSLERIREFVPA